MDQVGRNFFLEHPKHVQMNLISVWIRKHRMNERCRFLLTLKRLFSIEERHSVDNSYL